MNKFLRVIYFFIVAGIINACSQVLQTVDLDINTEDNLAQEKFNVVEKTLTINEARAQKNAPYLRVVLKEGRGSSAKPIPEKSALKSKFPNNSSPLKYRIGIGDTLAFSRLIENNQSGNEIKNQWPANTDAYNYRLGIGDTLTLTLIKRVKSDSQLAPSSNPTNQNLIITSQQSDETINSSGRIGSDGAYFCWKLGVLTQMEKA